MNRKEMLVNRWLARRRRRKLAGSIDFRDFGKGTNPEKIFRDLKEDAQHDFGHGGYSGTIAEKDGFKIRSRDPMTRAEADRFIDKDIDQNDKWGDAFAVPVASSKVLSEKEYTVRVKAKDARTAKEKAREIISAKGRSRKGTKVEIEMPYGSATQVRPGGVPELKIEKAKRTYYLADERYGGYSKHKTRKEAFEITKQRLAKDNVGNRRNILKVTEVIQITKEGDASKLPIWEVTGTRKQVAMGKVEGYLFYGYASS